MSCVALKANLSGPIIAAVPEKVCRRPGFCALAASLPLVSILGMIWLWRDTGDPVRLATHAVATFWYGLPYLPIILLFPSAIRSDMGLWLPLCPGC